MDLHENGKNLVTATFELPGLKKKDFNIDVHNGRLIISAETKMSPEHEQSGYAVRERQFGKLSRTLQLPQGINVSNFFASYNRMIVEVSPPIVGRNQGVHGERGSYCNLPQVGT